MVAGPGGHLQADRGGGRQRTGGKRGLAGLGEPVQRTATDQVDGAQLVQDPDTPEAEIVLIGQDQGGGEGLFGRGEVTLAFTLAQHLQRLAGLLVVPPALCRVQGDAGQRGGVVELAFAQSHPGGQNLAVAGDVTGCGQLLGEVELIAGLGPVGGHDRGSNQQQMRPCPPGGRGAHVGEIGQQPLADLAHLFCVAGRDQHLAQHLVDVDGTSAVIVIDQVSGPLEGGLGAGQRAATISASSRLEVQVGRLGRLPGRLGELGREFAPFSGQPRMCLLDRSQTTRGEENPLRGKKLGQNRLAGQGMAETEPPVTGRNRQQLGLGGPAKVGDHPGLVRTFDHVGQQAPVETPAEQRRRS